MFAGEGLQRAYERAGTGVSTKSGIKVRLTGRTPAGLRSRARINAKHLCESALALFGLIASAPLFAVCYAVIRADGGAMLYAHWRVGRHGKPFYCLKFRTMVVDADRRLAKILAEDPKAAEEWRIYQKLEKDPRITRFGSFLRKTHLDEIPQLLNVLRGEMSLIGPRPVTPGELERYGCYSHLYKHVRPGITGLWQVNDAERSSYTERVQLDVQYIRDWSARLDLLIAGKTLREMFLWRAGA